MSTQAALQALLNEHGVLSPALVVEAAADPDHELHDRFTWDDTEAAHRYRLVEAGVLIRSVKVTIQRGDNQEPIRVRAFVAERELGIGANGADPLTGSYVPVEDVIADDMRKTAWFRTLEREWQSLKRKAGESKEFAQMVLADLRELAG